MNQLYCLMVNGGSLNDEARTALFIAAQEMMDRRERKMRLTKAEHECNGWMETGYAYGMMGTVGGFIFKAEFDLDGQDIKLQFIARPMKDIDVMERSVWVKAPPFPTRQRRAPIYN